MAGIYVKGAHAPENCFKCPIAFAGWCDAGVPGEFTRPVDCPIQEVSNHGDLIDRSNIDVHIKTGFFSGERTVKMSDIEKLPVVLAADRG